MSVTATSIVHHSLFPTDYFWRMNTNIPFNAYESAQQYRALGLQAKLTIVTTSNFCY